MYYLKTGYYQLNYKDMVLGMCILTVILKKTIICSKL